MNRKRIWMWAALGCMAVASAAGAELPSLTVTTLEDVVDANDGLVSFREAVQYAADDAAGPKTLVRDGKYAIGFAAGVLGAADKIIRVDTTVGGQISLSESAFSSYGLVVAPPAGYRLDFDGKDEVYKLFEIGSANHVAFRNVDFHNFRPYGSAIDIMDHSDATFENCSFKEIYSGNSYTLGAAVYTAASRTLFTNCAFDGVGSTGCFAAWGGAVRAFLDSSDALCVFDRVSFRNCALNRGYGGAGCFEGGRVVLANVTATGCGAENGAAFYFGGSGENFLINSTVCGNSAISTSGGSVETHYDNSVKLTIVNSLLFNDTGSGRALRANDGTVGSPNVGCHASWVETWDAGYPQNPALKPQGTNRGTYFGNDFYLWQAYREDLNRWDYPGVESKVVDGVTQWYIPLDGASRAVAAGVAVKHNADWSAISYQYGNLPEVGVVGSGADIPLDYDQLGTSLASVPKNARTIGAVHVAGEAWGFTAVGADKARVALDGRIDVDHSCPPVVGGRTVTQAFVPKTWEGEIESSNYGYYRHCPEFDAWVVEAGNPRYASQDGVLYSADMKKLLAFPWAKEVPPTGFAVPSGVEVIGAYAVAENQSLTKVVLPASLRKIGAGAFYPSGLAEIEGGENVEEVERYAFQSTPYYANRGAGFNILGKALWGYNGEPPAELAIPDGVVSITEQLFSFEAIAKLTLPAGLKRIGTAAFERCENLATVVGGEDLRYVGREAFGRTAYVENAPEGVVRVGKVVIGYSGTAPSVLELPSDTVAIGGMAFTFQNGIETALVPDGVEVVGEYSFAACEKLKRVVFGSGVSELGFCIFYGSMELKEVSFAADQAPLYEGVYGPDDGFCYGEDNSSIGDFVVYAKPGATGWKLDENGKWNLRPVVFKPGIPVKCTWRVGSESGEFSNYYGAGATLPTWSREGYTVKWYDAETGGNEITADRKIDSFEGFTYYGRLTEKKPDDEKPEEEIVVPKLFAAPASTPFAGNATYNGWVRGADGKIVGLLSVKAAKAKLDKKTGENTSKLAVTYTPAGGKKQKLKNIPAAAVTEGGTPTVDIPGVGPVVLGGDSLAGVGFDLQAGADFSKDKQRKGAYNQAVAAKNGVWTLAFGTDLGYAGFSVTVKKGKGTLKGALPDGTKVSVSSQGIKGDHALAFPFVFAKSGKGTLSFVLWLNDDNTAEISDLSAIKLGKGQTLEVKEVVKPSKSFKLADGEIGRYLFKCEAFEQKFGVAGKKWNTPKHNKKPELDENPSSLKLSFTPKTGVVKGSFSIAPAAGAKVVKYTVNGVVVDGRFYGSASVKKGAEPFAVAAE